MTLQVFRYAWLPAMHPDTAGSYAILSGHVEGGADFATGDTGPGSVGIETPDDETSVLKLSNPALRSAQRVQVRPSQVTNPGLEP